MKVTKKQINETLRTENTTAIFRLYHEIYGKKANRNDVYSFIYNNAPTKRIKENAFDIAYCSKISLAFMADQLEKTIDFEKANEKHCVMRRFRQEINSEFSTYTKVPTMGNTHLYWCSPIYGHSDYNKSQSLAIKGNEKFCELICNVSNKIFRVNGK